MNISRKRFLRTLGFGTILGSLPQSGLLHSEAMQQARAAARGMKIKEIEIFHYDIPLIEPFTIAIGTMYAANNVLVRIRTDSGIVGLGEACPFTPITGDTQDTSIAAAKDLRTIAVGKDPLAVESLIKQFGALAHTNPSTVAAFDMALYDILGKVASLPLYRLFGGDRSSFETDITVSLDTTEKMIRSAKEFASRGYKTIKIKVGTDPDVDVERLQSMREAVGPNLNFRIDANQGWTVAQAIYALKRMEPVRIQFVEQPVHRSDLAGMKRVRDESPIPVMADESLFLPADAIQLIRADACDYFNIKLTKAAGIFNSIKIAHIADAANIRCMLGCMIDSRLALTAAAHVVAAHGNITFADLDGNIEHTVDPVIGGMIVKEGIITLPEGPGLGVDVDPAFLKRMKKV
ncbi:MAG: dipeptide epimerase [Ignavibacteria bacterium]|nr:dipeptide epimerase [Ignavibacteria bacterium]